MIDLYYWPTPNGWKISIMLEECGLPYTTKPIDIGRGEQFTPEFLKISPNNRMPAIVDHDPIGGGEPLSIFESGAILEYLAEKSGRFLPASTREKYSVRQWLYWQVGGLGPMAGQWNHFATYAADKIPYAIDRYAKELDRLYGVMERELEVHTFLGSAEYSIADIAAWSWVLPKRQEIDLARFPKVKAWFETIGARPAVQAGKKVGSELSRPLDDASKKVLFGQTSGR